MVAFKTSLAATMLILLLGCSDQKPAAAAALSAPPQLFVLAPTPSHDSLPRSSANELARLSADPAAAEVAFVRLAPELVSQRNEDLTVSVPGKKTVQFHLRDFTAITPEIFGWVGYTPSAWKQAHPDSPAEIANDPMFFLSLVREGNNVLGDLTLDGQHYRLQPIGSGLHVLVKVDESKLPPESEPRISGVAAQAPEASEIAKSAHSTIRVMFVVTDQRKALSPNYKADLALALNNANQYMKSSDVQITYELAGYYDGGYDETGRSYNQQLDDLRLAKPFADKVLAQREALGADLVSMYSTAPQYCGLAWLTASKAQAHSVISCSSSLAHELGHNLGVNHGWKPGDPERNPPYMHGYQHDEAPIFRTIMTGTNGAIPYFSNPRLQYQGVPMGTVYHNDAARRFNERRQVVEDFYPPLASPK